MPTNLNLKAWAQLVVTPQQCQVVEFLTSGFLAGFEGRVPTPSMANHASTRPHQQDISHYIITEIGHGAMLGPFDHPPFTPWCQSNPLLTHSKKDSTSRLMIMDLSWALSPGSSINRGMLKETYFGVPKKMRLSSVLGLASFIREAGRGVWLFSCDVAIGHGTSSPLIQ